MFVRKRRARNALLIVIVGLYLIITGLYAVRTPDWQAPDEPAHYNYVAQIAERGILPVIEPGDWDAAYLEALKSSRFDPALLDRLDSIQYEDHQPPLFYALAAPVYIMTDGSLTALRLFSALIGTAVVLSAFGVGLLMFPERPAVALAAAAFVAFLPQHVAILASVNNDSLGWAVAGVTLAAITAYLKERPVQAWQLGLLVGVGFLTKATTYFLGPVALLAILLRWWSYHYIEVRAASDLTFPEETRRDFLQPPVLVLLREVALFLAPALLLGGMWWLRCIDVYGFPDFLGLAAHDAVVVGQPRTAALIETLGLDGYVRELIRVTFSSFWGQFGWMALPLQPRFYTAIQAALLFLVAGLAVDMLYVRPRKNAVISHTQRNVWIVLGAAAALVLLAFVYYNTEFQQHQGRYLFSLLVPLSLWLALGLDGWRQWLVMRFRLTGSARRLATWAVAAAFLPLAAWDVWLLWRVIVPNL